MPNPTEAPDMVVFDITGTIITSTEAVADAFTAAFGANGIQITAEELQPWRGAPKRLAIRSLIQNHSLSAPSEEQVETVYSSFHQGVCQRFEAEALRLITGVSRRRSHGAWSGDFGWNTGFDHRLSLLDPAD